MSKTFNVIGSTVVHAKAVRPLTTYPLERVEGEGEGGST